MNIVHISKFRRYGSSQGIHLGGVAKSAAYLQKAIPELKIYSWDSFPEWYQYGTNTADWDAALVLNEWLLTEGYIGKDTTVICDGFWGLGLPGRVGRLISICHGSYLGAIVEYEKTQWDEQTGFWLGAAAREQDKFWRESGCEIVAVSHETGRELELLTGISPWVIPHGIDTDAFSPSGERESDLILEVAMGIPWKGSAIVDHIKAQGYNVQSMAVLDGSLEREARRWGQARVLLHPSHYEGCPYALLEAMACGVIPVAYATGIACELGRQHGEITDDHHLAVFAHLINKAILGEYDPRQYVLERHRFEIFAGEWRKYLG